MKRIFFIHIAKTGGVSLERNLVRQTSMMPCPAYHWQDLYGLDNIDAYDLFMGHLQYFCKDLVGEAFRFTILREPVERAMSGWEHIRRSPQHPLNPRLSAAPTIDLALEDHALRRHISNSMTRFLGCKPEFDKFCSKKAAIQQALQHTPDRAMLENAKACIDELDFVGFTESLNVDTLKLFEALGVGQASPENLIVTNNNPLKKTSLYRDSLDKKTTKLLESANELDCELYEYATKAVAEKKSTVRYWGETVI